MSITIETDLKDILNRLDQRFDKLDQKIDRIQEDVTDLKISLTKVEGKIETLDERLTGEIKTLDERLTGQIKTLDANVDGVSTRIGNQEFIARSVLGGLIIIILGGGISMFANFIPLK
jgi:chromosome segregation ATPase